MTDQTDWLNPNGLHVARATCDVLVVSDAAPEAASSAINAAPVEPSTPSLNII